MMGGAQVTLLGQFEVSVDGKTVEIKSSKERALLARLALAPGTVVAADSLIDAIWPDERPNDPPRALRYHVWHLRDLLEPHRADRSEGTLVLTRPAGYLLAVDAPAVDAVRLEADWVKARSLAHDPRSRRDTLGMLLDAWHPAAFAEAADRGPLAQAALRLDRLRSTILSDRVAADIALGCDVELVPELEQLVAAHPFDERLRGHLMTALYRAGRQADALAVYAATRALLVEELGVEPGPELRDLEHRILRHDEALAGNALRNAGAPILRADDLRTNLPHPVDSFVGRDNEIAELRRLLGDYRLVTLTGAGGIGKTRLAVETGRRLVDDYAHGVWLAELAPVIDDDLVATVVAETWELTAAESDVDDLVISFLRPRQLVLVLDNCEHVSGAASRFATRVLREAPGVRILATSRESLGVPGEAALRVPSLDHGGSGDAPGAAAALFVDRGRAARPGWAPSADDAAAIDRICERLDGIPLGLELAAGRLRSMAPTEIADHLDHSLGMLALAAKNGVPRHRTLAATVEWSYRLLSEPEQALFRCVSVFIGGFDLAAASAVCGASGVSAVDVDDLMDSLVDKSLVLAAPGSDGTRYRLLEPLRQWAHEQLVRNGEADAVRLEHAHHFARLISDLSPVYHGHGQEVALRRTLTDYPNVRLALATLADTGDADRHLDVCFRLFSFWAHQSMHLEGFQTCRRSLDVAGPGADLMAQVKTAFVGSVCGAWTRRSDVVEMAAQGRDLAEQLGNPRATAWAELALAVVHGNDGLPRGAAVAVPDTVTAEPMQRAVDLWAAHPGPAWWDPIWERGLQQLCCSIFLPYGPDRLAEFRASQTAFETIGDRGWLAILYAQSLDHLEFAGPEITRQLLEEGAGIGLSPSWSHAARYRLGVLHQLLGDHQRAISELTATIVYRQKVGDSNWTAEARFLTISQCELGHLDAAARLIESVFSNIATDRGEREAQRTLAVAAYVLEAAGERGLAARALGGAGPFQDNFVDTLGTVRARLTANPGTSAAETLVAEGAASHLSDLIAEVRAALAGLDVGVRE